MLATHDLPHPNQIQHEAPYQIVDRGWIHLDRCNNFACIKLTRSKSEAQRLSAKLFGEFVALGTYAKYGVARNHLALPIPILGDEDIGPHVSIFQYNERPDWDKLEGMQGTSIKIDRLKPHEIIFTPKTRSASNMFLIGVESRELDELREKIGVNYVGRSEEMILSWRPHIAVAVVPLNVLSYPVPKTPDTAQ